MSEKEMDSGYEIEKRMTFRIHDMPIELVEEFLHFTKTECGNKGWVAIKTLLEYRKIFSVLTDHEMRLSLMETQGIDATQKEEESEEKKFKPIGGGLKNGKV